MDTIKKDIRDMLNLMQNIEKEKYHKSNLVKRKNVPSTLELLRNKRLKSKSLQDTIKNQKEVQNLHQSFFRYNINKYVCKDRDAMLEINYFDKCYCCGGNKVSKYFDLCYKCDRSMKSIIEDRSLQQQLQLSKELHLPVVSIKNI